MRKSYDLETKVNNESIRTNVAFLGEQFIWVNDMGIGGIYTIDKFTFDVKCMIDPARLYKYGKFEIISIFQWNNYIVVVPDELDKSWIIYDKSNEKVQYKRISTDGWKLSGLYFVGEIGYLIPATIDYPIVIISLEKLSITQMIKGWWRKGGIHYNLPLEIWHLAGTVSENCVYFYIYNTKYVMKINKENVERYSIEHIPYGIVGISYSDGEIWVLPKKGKCIYVLNENAIVLNSIQLFANKQELSADYFSRIIATNKYVFMLPRSDTNIYFYNKQKGYIKIINAECRKLKNLFSISCNGATYWESCFDENRVYLMPLTNQLLIINMDTLMCEAKDVSLPSSIQNFGLIYWFGWNRWFIKDVIGEEIDEKSLKTYCEIIEKNVSAYERSSNRNGKRIWKKIN